MRRIFGLSRVRDEKGVIVKRKINPWVNCIHTLVGAGYETMQVLLIEYEEDSVEHGGGGDMPDSPGDLPQGGVV